MTRELLIFNHLKIFLSRFTLVLFFVFLNSCNPIADKAKTTIESDNLKNSAGLNKLKDSIKVTENEVLDDEGNETSSFVVSGIKESDIIYIYSDSSCTNLLETIESNSNQLTLSKLNLEDGTYRLYFKRYNPNMNLFSDCIDSKVDYVATSEEFVTVSINQLNPVNILNEAAYNVNGECSENGQNVEVSLGSLTETVVCNSLEWIATFDTTTLNDGTISVVADHQSETGISADQATINILKDTVAPTAIFNSTPVVNNFNKESYTFSGSCSEDEIVNISVDGQALVVNCNSGSWSKTHDVSTLSDGEISIIITHEDTAKNSTTSSVNVTKDTVVPNVTFSSTPVINYSNNNVYIFSGGCSEEENVSVTIGGDTSTVSCNANSWTKTFDASGLSDGNISISISEVDTAGNEAVQTTSVLKDTVAPIIAITSHSIINNSNKENYTISGNCSESTDVTVNIGELSSTVSCSLNTWSKNLNVSSLSDGNVTVSISQSDSANNSSTSIAVVTKDVVIPNVAITLSPVINSSNLNNYTFSGECSESTESVFISIAGLSHTVLCNSGNWSKNVDLSTVADGEITISASHVDSAGNSSANATVTVIKNTTAVSVSIDPLNSINDSNKESFTVSGNCSAYDEPVELNIGSINITPTCSAGTWSISQDLSGLSDGNVTITADHSDSEENSADQVSTTIVKDVVAPTVSFSSTPVIVTSNVSNYDFLGTCSENEDVSIDIGGLTSIVSCSSGSWSKTQDMSSVLDGNVSISITHLDDAQNISTATTSVIKDTTGPSITISVSPTIKSSNESAYTISGTCEGDESVSVNVGSLSSSVACSIGSWTKTQDVSSLSDGDITISISQNDEYANSTSASNTITKDTTGPSIAISVSPTIKGSNESAYTVSGTCEGEESLSVNVGSLSSSVACSTGSWTKTQDVSSLSDGDVTISISQNDEYTNSSSTSVTVTKDTSGPTITISALTINSSIDSAYTVSGTCEGAGNVSVNIGSLSSSVACSTGSWIKTQDVSSLSDGDVTISISQNDEYTNSSSTSTTVTKDTSGPTITISALTINSSIDSAYTVSGTCEGEESVSVNVGSLSSSVACSTGAWTKTQDVSSLSDGDVTISISQNDEYANSTSASTTVTKDTTGPSIAISVSPTIKSSNESAYTISGTCEGEESVSVNVGSLSSSVACSTGSWTKTQDVSSLSDGDVTISISQNDEYANSTSASNTITKDTTGPSTTLTANTINSSNVTSYSISGTCEGAGNVSVNIGSLSSSVACNSGAWTKTQDVSSLSDGDVTISISQNDEYANSSSTSTTVTKDTTGPSIAITSSPLIKSSSESAYTISGTCEGEESVSVNVGSLSSSVACNSGTWTKTQDVSSLSDGDVTISISQNDEYENSSSTSTTVTKDTTGPSIALSVFPTIKGSNESAYTVSGTCEGDESVSVNVGSLSSSVACNSGAWTKTQDVSSLSDGDVTISISQNDEYANSTNASNTITKDTTGPSIAISVFPTIKGSNESAYTVSGTCEGDESVSVNVGSLSSSVACNSGVWTKTQDVSSLSDGDVTISISQNDEYANSSSTSTTVTKDITGPSIAISVSPTIKSSNESAYTISGTCEGDESVSVNVGSLSSSVACNSGAWTITQDVSSLSDGDITISISQNDENANTSSTSATVTKDTTGPSIAISVSPTIKSSNESAYTVSGTCEGEESVSVNVGSLSSSVACNSGAWTKTKDVSSLSNGDVTISISQNDEYANSSSTSTTITKDTTGPSIVISVSPTIKSSNESAYTVSGTCEGEESVSVNIGSLSSSVACNSGAWTKTQDVSSLSDGDVTISISQNDEYANSTSASNTITKDTTGPSIAISVSPTIKGSNKSAYTISGTCEGDESVSVNIGSLSSSVACNSGAWTKTQDVSSLSDGDVTISISQNDEYANSSSTSTTITKDTLAPTSSLDSPGVINAYNNLNYTLSGSCSEVGGTVTVVIGTVTDTADCTGASWSSVFNMSGFSDGSFNITVDHADSAANSATQITSSVSKDTSIPTIAITSSSDIDADNDESYTVSGTCSENTQTVSLSVGGIVATATCSSGSWSANVNVSSLSDGTISITADLDDASGNSATQATASVDKTTIVIVYEFTMESPIDITMENYTNYGLSGTCTTNGTNVNVSIGSLNFSSACNSNVWGMFNLDVSSLSDGNISITADHASETQLSSSVTKDLATEFVSILQIPHITSSNETSYTASGACSTNSSNVVLTIGTESFTMSCTNNTWTTGSVDVSSLADAESISVTASHTTATDVTTSIYKDTYYPVAISLALSNTLNDTVTLSFSLENPNSFTVDDYIINYRQKGTTTWLAFDDGINIGTALNVTGLFPGMYYEFRVQCLYDTTSYSNWSNIVTGQTQPDSPVFGLNKAMNVGAATSSVVTAFQDNTTVSLNGTTIATINAGQTHAFTSAAFDIIDADKPIFTVGLRGTGASDKSANIVWMPTSWAGKLFGFSNYQNTTHSLNIYAIEDTSVSLIQGTTTISTATISADGNTTLTWSVNGPYQLVSSGSILAYAITIGNGTKLIDPRPLMPNSTEIIGIPSSVGRLATTVDFTNYGLIHSNSVTHSGALNKTSYYDITPEGTSTDYESKPVLISGSNGINAASFDDGDGDSAAPFMPTSLMRKHFIIPNNSSWIAFAAKECATITVRSPDGVVQDTITMTRSGGNTNAPCGAYYANPTVGYIFSADEPVAAWFQSSNNSNASKDDETIMYGTNESPF